MKKFFILNCFYCVFPSQIMRKKIINLMMILYLNIQISGKNILVKGKSFQKSEKDVLPK